MIDVILYIVLLTILVSHVGIAWGLLMMPGNLFDWVPGKIQRIKNPYLRDLLTCSKCISGQAALWVIVGAMIYQIDFILLVFGLFWIMLVIVVTDQLNKRYGYG